MRQVTNRLASQRFNDKNLIPKAVTDESKFEETIREYPPLTEIGY